MNRETTQWPKVKVQKDKQRSTKYTHQTKDRVTRTPLKIGGEITIFKKIMRQMRILNKVRKWLKMNKKG